MTLWILDTDHISLLQRGHPAVEQHICRINLNDIAITIISVEEQLYGRLNRIRRAKSPETLKTAYQALYETLDDFKAAIALSINSILITRNQRDFAKVPNLVLEDWSTIVSG